MKKRLAILLAATAALAVAVAVSAKPASARDYARSGSWTAYYLTAQENTTGNVPVCGLRTGNPATQVVYLKLFGGSKNLTIDIFKDGWQIPEGTKATVNVWFDKEQAGTAEAIGTMLRGKGFALGELKVRIGPEELGEFFEGFAHADKMLIEFPGGTEKTWVIDMTGSREMQAVLLECAKRLPGPSTQPYGRQPEVSTQPFGAQPDTQPTQPSKLPTPTGGA